jgi:hypothetical protein
LAIAKTCARSILKGQVERAIEGACAEYYENVVRIEELSSTSEELIQNY